MSFRFAATAEVAEAGRLAAHSFPAAGRTAAWWLEQLGDPTFGGGAETLWVGEEDGRLVAACQLHPLRQWVGGSDFPVMGLGTVAIAPTHRRRGLAGRLVATALRAARDRGDAGSALYPFRVSFYRRLGYGLAGRALQYRVAPECFPDAPERSGVSLVDSDAARAAVRDLYARWIRTQTGQIERSERRWQQILAGTDRAPVAFRAPEGGVDGYALTTYRVDLPPPGRGLLAWLGSLGDQWRQVVFRALPWQHVGEEISEPRLPGGGVPSWGLWFPSAALLAGPMFRLLDMPAWERRAVAPDAEMTVALEVADEQLDENAGAWRLRLEGGRAAVERTGGGAADLSLRLDISTLSRLFVAALAPSGAHEAGLLAADRPDRLAALDRALRLPEPWTFDRF